MLPFEQSHSKTVYSCVWPETERLMITCFQQETRIMMDRHQAPHTKIQDTYGPDFAKCWWDWSGVSDLSVHNWPEFYPSNGASEAIREVINELAVSGGSLIVFDGEYEGYAAIASGKNIPIISIARSNWRNQWKSLQKNIPTNSQWWISEPSSLNGCSWEEFDNWAAEVSNHPCVELWWDASYVGATLNQKKFDCSLFTGMVFSLSKPAGVYYRRIGGCFSRRPISGLWGNRWFKNIDSIYLGQRWLEQYPRGMIAQKYAALQHDLIKHWNKQSKGHPWLPSDVVVLAYAPEHTRPHTETDDRYLRNEWYRVCITPAMHQLIQQSQL